MAYFEFSKNSSDKVYITPSKYQEYDLIDIRVYAENREGELIPTKKGVSLNIDQIPTLINGLYWALQQPCTEDLESPPENELNHHQENRLADLLYKLLKEHGMSIHWDTIERMLLEDTQMEREFNKWQIHYVLAKRRDIFKSDQPGCFQAVL